MRVRLSEEKKIKGKVRKKRAKKFSKGYRKQRCYLLQLYDPSFGVPVGVIPIRTKPTFDCILKDLEELNLYPLILPQPVYVPEEFWLKYREEIEDRDKLIKEYGLLKDSSIYRYETVVIDIDSPFKEVYPVWKELKNRMKIRVGYQIYRTKSGRFRAYIYLLDGTKDLKRAKEFLAIIYAFFEKKGLKADPTFVYRLNHPVFYEEFPLYSYEVVEEKDGKNRFFRLYRNVKELQKELNLYEFNGKNLTEWIWDKKLPVKKRKKCKILKAPAFVRKLEKEVLDALELWKRRVSVLAKKRSSYRYIYVIQPAIGWAKYLNLPESEVTEFLEELLGEEKKKDIEKGWKYARELVFEIPERIEWFGKTREEWEGLVLRKLRRRKTVLRQELLREVFYNQKWLCDLVMEGLKKKGLVVFDLVRYGRGRPRKVYKFVEIEELPVRKAVGCETMYLLELKPNSRNKTNFAVIRGNNLAKNNNSLSVRERAMGGGWYWEDFSFGSGYIYRRGVLSSFRRVTCSVPAVFRFLDVYSDVLGLLCSSYFSAFREDVVSGKGVVDSVFYSLLQQSRITFDLVELSGKVRKEVWLLSYSLPNRLLVLSDGTVSLQDLGRFNFTGKDAVKFFKEILPELPPSEGFPFAEGKRFFIYPYAADWEEWELLKYYPYFLVLHRSSLLKGRKPRRVHRYSVVYKILLSAFTFFKPYPEDLVWEGEPVVPHKAGVWREGAKEIAKFIFQEFKDRKSKELLVTFALKDGREVTGLLNKKRLSGFYYVLSNPSNEKEKIFIPKHAVDDFWIEEQKLQ